MRKPSCMIMVVHTQLLVLRVIAVGAGLSVVCCGMSYHSFSVSATPNPKP